MDAWRSATAAARGDGRSRFFIRSSAQARMRTPGTHVGCADAGPASFSSTSTSTSTCPESGSTSGSAPPQREDEICRLSAGARSSSLFRELCSRRFHPTICGRRRPALAAYDLERRRQQIRTAGASGADAEQEQRDGCFHLRSSWPLKLQVSPCRAGPRTRSTSSTVARIPPVDREEHASFSFAAAKSATETTLQEGTERTRKIEIFLCHQCRRRGSTPSCTSRKSTAVAFSSGVKTIFMYLLHLMFFFPHLVANAALESLGENHYRASAADFATLIEDYGSGGFFVEFQVPWSQQCQRWAPIFKQAAKESLENKHIKDELKITIPFVEVDMTVPENLSLASSYMLSGFPTFMYFAKPNDAGWKYDPDEPIPGALEYGGEPSAPSVIEFLESVAGRDAVQYGTPDANHERLSMLLVTDNDKMLQAFTNVAKKNRKRARWHNLKVSEYAKGLSASHTGNPYQQSNSGAFVELRHRSEPPVYLDLEKIPGGDSHQTEKQLELMMETHKFPAYGKIDRATFTEYAGSPLLWVLPDVGDEHEFEDRADDFREVMLLAAQKQMETLRPGGVFSQGEKAFRIAATNTISFKGSIQAMFGVSEFPQLVAQLKPGTAEYFLYDADVKELMVRAERDGKTQGDVDAGAQRVVEWFSKIRSGELQKSFKSEPVPDYEVEPGEPKIVVAKTLEQSIYQQDKDVFLNVYAPWCGHCKRFSPEFRKVARKVQQSGMDKHIFVGILDGTANESPLDEVQWSGFPTVFFVKAGTKSIQEYMGKRDAETVYLWLRSVSTFQGSMDVELGEVKMDL